MTEIVGSPQQAELNKALAEYRIRRLQRYSTVNVLLLTWADENIGLQDEIVRLTHVFQEELNYFVWPYRIPTKGSQVELQLQISQYIKLWGSTEDALLIVYYTGHGGWTRDNTSSECIWAARLSGGPTLDWSIIQPLLIAAICDVVIVLDCCFAGQAVRSRINHNVEFLAATDKDQFTPDGTDPEKPAFTKIFVDQMSRMLKEEGYVTIPGLVSRMTPKETGIVKQPYYVPLSPDGTGGTIRLSRWEPLEQLSISTNTSVNGSSEAAMFLRLSLFTPLDTIAREVLQKWMTRNSPSIVHDIAVVEQAISEAKAIQEFASETLLPSPEPPTVELFSWLPGRAHGEAVSLLRSLERTLRPPPEMQFDKMDAVEIVQKLSDQSAALVNFLHDNLASLNVASLEQLQSGVRHSVKDLSSRIKMRLSLLGDDPVENTIAVKFNNPSQSMERIRLGMIGEAPVLVEYWYYTDARESHHATADFRKCSTRAARICALLKEEKIPAFKTLLGLGYLHETLHEPRIGFVYQMPLQKRLHIPLTLLQIINRVKIVPLDIRRQLASSLCLAVLNLHSIGWYHKGLRSDNIIIFGKSQEAPQESTQYEDYDFDHPFIIGFDCSRPTEAESSSATSDAQVIKIYRHPDRWTAQKRFERHHDLYALGVLLVEIGCWRTLASLDPKKKGFGDVRKGYIIKDYLLGSGMKRLQHAAGTTFANAAMYCIQDQDWSGCEEWEAQSRVRQHVFRPLTKEC